MTGGCIGYGVHEQRAIGADAWQAEEGNERCRQPVMGGESAGAMRGDVGARRRAATRFVEALWSAPAVAALPATDAEGVVSRLLLEAVRWLAAPSDP
jgi:hypothetical protein